MLLTQKGEIMKITKAVEYALFAVGHVAKYGGDGFVTASSISKEHDIPLPYLSRTIQELVRTGILKNKMGSTGGFKLAKPANEISMLDIIEIIDGPLDKLLVTSHKTNDEPFMINMETVCKGVIAKAKDTLQKAKISKMIK
jgi:Rrf2 family protein